MIPEPPESLSDAAKAAWVEVVSTHPKPESIVRARLEAFCLAVATLREAHEKIASEGLVVEDASGPKVANPALAIAQSTTEALRKWGQEFRPRQSVPRRRSGPMYDATTESITAAAHLRDRKEFSGAVAAAKTLAWLIDEAQRAGLEELQKAAFGTIPTYLRVCEALQITPASRPAAESKPAAGGGRLAHMRSVAGGKAAG